MFSVKPKEEEEMVEEKRSFSWWEDVPIEMYIKCILFSKENDDIYIYILLSNFQTFWSIIIQNLAMHMTNCNIQIIIWQVNFKLGMLWNVASRRLLILVSWLRWVKGFCVLETYWYFFCNNSRCILFTHLHEVENQRVKRQRCPQLLLFLSYI